MNKLKFYEKITGKNGVFDKIGDVHIDSRKVRANDVFIAIRGGNSYVEDVLKKGASLVFYDDKSLNITSEKATLVEDSVSFLQELAKKYRKTLDVKVIGITGSEGKTSTKDILYNILSEKYKGKKTLGNFNNHIGLPLTLLRLEEDDKFIALEMGMSDLGEIDTLSCVAKPDYALITNIGDSHLEFLKNRDNVFKAKTEIFDYVKVKNRVVYGDDVYFKESDAIKVGCEEYNDYLIEGFKQDKEGSNFNLTYKNQTLEIESNLYGFYNAVNTSLSIVIALELGLNLEEIKKACKNLELTKMRFERVEKAGKIFINDAYNASPVAMEVSLKTFDEVFKGQYKVAVLGDMLELGENSKKYHEDLSLVLEKLDFKEIYLVGKEMKSLYEKLNGENIFHCEKVEEVKEKILDIKDEACVFLKASNGISLNKILD